jgi:hypothetical protein
MGVDSDHDDDDCISIYWVYLILYGSWQVGFWGSDRDGLCSPVCLDDEAAGSLGVLIVSTKPAIFYWDPGAGYYRI